MFLPSYIFYTSIFVLGLLVGSFLNSVIYRLHSGESIIKKRSHCPECGHVLSWHELIPVISFVIQRGKCRACGEKISWQYPAVEIATAILFVLIFNFQFSNFQSIFEFSNFQLLIFLYLLIITSLLVIIFVYDLKHYLIPNKIIYPAILVSGIWYLVSGIFFDRYTIYDILNTTYVAFGAAGFFLIIVLMSRGKWMGVGDVKLSFFMGIFLGWPNILPALFLAFVLGGIIGIGLIVGGKKTMKSQVPFGPFLVLGTFVAFFWGRELIGWYLGLLM